MDNLRDLIYKVRACKICEPSLPMGAKPILQLDSSAKILIVGQAPGKQAHLTGVPFDDASGKRLRLWMGISDADFYNKNKVAILPMGFCYPGTAKSGDLPPRPECIDAWREQLMAQLSAVQLTLVIGQYAQHYHLAGSKKTVTEQVKDWQLLWPKKLPLPHPSPRNNIWLKKNEWFERDVIPALKKRVKTLLKKSR